MGPPLGLLLCCFAAIAATSAAQDTWIYMYDTHEPISSRPQAQLSSQEASIILSRRIGYSNDLLVGDIGDDLISKIDLYGGYQRRLFDAGGSVPKLFVEVEGLNSHVKSRDFPPHFEASKLLSLDRENNEVIDERCVQNVNFGLGTTGRMTYDHLTTTKCTMRQPVSLSEALRYTSSSISAQLLIDLSENTDKLSFLKELGTHLSDAATINGIQSTLVVYTRGSRPPTTKPTTYVNRRRAPEEEPLPDTTTPLSSPLTILQNATTPKPLNGTIRLCYSNETNCQTKTNNCSSHGHCRLSSKDASSSPPSECWSCSCGRTTVRVNDDGSEKTVQWGGNACQKKDISMEFWLFAGFGVAMAAAIAWGVGLLFSMGGEELPSVLGAGVVGPRAQR